MLRKLPQQFKSVTRVSELMQTPEGRAYWKANGIGIVMEFDLTPGSNSMQTLEDYAQSKGVTRSAAPPSKPAGDWEDQLGVETAPILTDDDDAVLDEIWKRLYPNTYVPGKPNTDTPAEPPVEA